MEKLINAGKLFCDKYHAVILCEYQRDLALLKCLIEMVESAVEKKSPATSWCHDDICYRFAKSIVDYGKMAYDTMQLGHFNATLMIVRTIIENNVCLDILLQDATNELWKYYLTYSYKHSTIREGRETAPHLLSFMDEIYQHYNIDADFIEMRGEKKPYIDLPYGWTYKINKKFNFAGLCELVNAKDYDDFKMMSEYSHGTAIYLKLGGLSSMDHIMTMISSLYIGIYRLVTMYCWDTVDPEFDDVTDEIESLIYQYLEL